MMRPTSLALLLACGLAVTVLAFASVHRSQFPEPAPAGGRAIMRMSGGEALRRHALHRGLKATRGRGEMHAYMRPGACAGEADFVNGLNLTGSTVTSVMSARAPVESACLPPGTAALLEALYFMDALAEQVDESELSQGVAHVIVPSDLGATTQVARKATIERLYCAVAEQACGAGDGRVRAACENALAGERLCPR
jgi:hypothetical protein